MENSKACQPSPSAPDSVLKSLCYLMLKIARNWSHVFGARLNRLSHFMQNFYGTRAGSDWPKT